MAGRVRLLHLDRSIALMLCAKQISVGPAMVIPTTSIHVGRKERNAATATYVLVSAKPRSTLCVSIQLQLHRDSAKLQSSGSLRLTDKTTRRRLGAQATPRNPHPGLPQPSLQGPLSIRLGWGMPGGGHGCLFLYGNNQGKLRELWVLHSFSLQGGA